MTVQARTALLAGLLCGALEIAPSATVGQDRLRAVGVARMAELDSKSATEPDSESVAESNPFVIQKAEYESRLRAMWLGQNIANWTGLLTEGKRISPPFLTDDDWGVTNVGRGIIDFVLDQNPWKADDDTDIEYVYLHLLDSQGGAALLPEQIANGWRRHINRKIWVSNAVARGLMERGVLPPATGMATANKYWLRIDAQLTTEFFGAFCPGMPLEAMKMADPAIRTTSAGYASHAAQFFVLLYSHAAVVDQTASPRQQVLWLVREARRYIPETSKTADIADFVLADYLANPDPEDWESTRDRIYERYQLFAAVNGFKYRSWTESSINFATAIMALLYGEGDYRRTIQIGTLSGWDSDNPTATMGGLLGLMLGYDALVAQFPGQPFSDRYWISRTRDNLPDHTPGDPQAEDTFSLMAARMIPIVERRVLQAGGDVIASGQAWQLPPTPRWQGALSNPLTMEAKRSANNRVRLQGGLVIASSSVGMGNPPPGLGVGDVSLIGNGFEHNFLGSEPDDKRRWFYSSQGTAAPLGGEISLAVIYDRPVPVHTVRFIEGNHFDQPEASGGWFETLATEVLIGGAWVPPAGGAVRTAPLDRDRPFQIIDFVLNNPVMAIGIRVVGRAGGADQFVTCAEIDALTPPQCLSDCDSSGTLDLFDFLCFQNSFVNNGPYACDCDTSTGSGVCDLFDFLCFQNAFVSGCS